MEVGRKSPSVVQWEPEHDHGQTAVPPTDGARAQSVIDVTPGGRRSPSIIELKEKRNDRKKRRSPTIEIETTETPQKSRAAGAGETTTPPGARALLSSYKIPRRTSSTKGAKSPTGGPQAPAEPDKEPKDETRNHNPPGDPTGDRAGGESPQSPGGDSEDKDRKEEGQEKRGGTQSPMEVAEEARQQSPQRIRPFPYIVTGRSSRGHRARRSVRGNELLWQAEGEETDIREFRVKEPLRGGFGARREERHLVRKAYKHANLLPPQRWTEAAERCVACRPRPADRHTCSRPRSICRTCSGAHPTSVCHHPWHEVEQEQDRLDTVRSLTAMEGRELFRRRQGWADLLRRGFLYRTGGDAAGRAYAHRHHGTVLWYGSERWIPPMAMGGVYVPTPVPTNVERQGLVQLLSLETLPEESQHPEAFVPHVVWRGCRVSLELCHWLAALGYSSRSFLGPWTPEALQLIWEASAAGLHINLDAWNQLRLERLATADRARRRALRLPRGNDGANNEEEESFDRRPGGGD